MNILIRKLIFNESEIHLILWNDRPCFLVSELSKALDSVKKEDIPLFLRKGESAVKGIDYDVVGGSEARELRSNLEDSGMKKRFTQAMIIYFDGLRKYFNYRKTIESMDFINYLGKCKISLEASSVTPVSSTEAPPPIEKQKVNKTVQKPDPKAVTYSDLLKHISFMEEFVEAFNSINITPDKSVAFTKGMTKFLEDNGVQAAELLREMKKWIV